MDGYTTQGSDYIQSTIANIIMVKFLVGGFGIFIIGVVISVRIFKKYYQTYKKMDP